MEGVEFGSLFVRHDITADQRRDMLNFGARLLACAAGGGYVEPWEVAYWQLRLAKGALRAYPRVSPGLAKTLTPDGAARWAMSHMPGSREELAATAADVRAESRDDDEELDARPASSEGLMRPEPRIRMLNGVDRVLVALGWIDLALLEEETRADAEVWLRTRPRLSWLPPEPPRKT